MILDCFYGGRREGLGVHGHKEIIAASEEPDHGLEENRISFSRDLCNTLGHLKGRSFTTKHLYQTLCSFGPTYRPVHVILSSHKEDSIMLSSIPPRKQRPRSTRYQERNMRFDLHLPNMPSSADQIRAIGTWVEHVMQVRLDRSNPTSNASDLSFSFSGAPSVANDLQRLGEMARDAPVHVQSGLRDAKVEVTYQPNSEETEDGTHSTPVQIAELVESLNINMEIKRSLTQARYYRNVAVLPIMFDSLEADYGTLEDDLENLRRLFTDNYNFAVHTIFKIPTSGDGHERLSRRIMQLTSQHWAKEELIIILYAGLCGNAGSRSHDSSSRRPSALWIP